MKQELQKLPPAWHGEAAQLLNENFEKIHIHFVESTKRAVWMGMFLNHIKSRGKEDGSIPHGQFTPWLEKNAPNTSYSQLHVYMKLAVEVCEKGSFQISEFGLFAKSGDLPPKIEKMIEGKTQAQLFLQFKNVDADGEPLKPGCAPGKRGKIEEPPPADLEEKDFIYCVESDLLSLTNPKDKTLQEQATPRLAKFRLHLESTLRRIDEIVNARKHA